VRVIEGREVLNVDIKDEPNLQSSMDTLHKDLSQEQKILLSNLKTHSFYFLFIQQR
jgi:hypothetical protein